MSSHAERKGRRFLSRRFHVGPIIKALLISVAVEVAVLLLTISALASYVTRMYAGDSGDTPRHFMAELGIGFHYISILITEPLGLLILAPLVQVVMMTYLLGMVFRVRERSRSKLARPSVP